MPTTMWLTREVNDIGGDAHSTDVESSMPKEAEPSDPQPSQPPDGGWMAWVQVMLTHIVFFNTWGVANGYGIFQQYYSQRLNQSESSISWIGSVQVFFLFSVGVVAGRLTDGGHFRIIFTCGVFLQVLGIFMTSLCMQYWQIFLAQSVCLGLGKWLHLLPGSSCPISILQKVSGF